MIILTSSNLIGCASKSDSLYQDVGGKRTLDKVFGLAINRIYNDPNIEHYFNNVPKRHLRMHLTNQTCELIDGPCKYKGTIMTEAHQGHYISGKNVFTLVEYVQGARRDIGLTVQQ